VRLWIRWSTAVHHSRGPVIAPAAHLLTGEATLPAPAFPDLTARHATTASRIVCAQLGLPGGALSAQAKEALANARPGVELVW